MSTDTHTLTHTPLSLSVHSRFWGRYQHSPSSSWPQAQGLCVTCAPAPAGSAETHTHTAHPRSCFSGYKLFLPQWLQVKHPLAPAAGTETPLAHSEATSPCQRHRSSGVAPRAATRSSPAAPQQLAPSPGITRVSGIGNEGAEVRWMRAGRTHGGDQVQPLPESH